MIAIQHLRTFIGKTTRTQTEVRFLFSLLYLHIRRTRWTLTVCFKALPWKPVLRFTGISDYIIDAEARVIKQEDFWDSINLRQGI